MCMASTYVRKIETITEELERDLNKLRLKQSETDKLVNKAYHKLETTKFNACEGYYIAKDLQNLLQKRRLIKSELYRMEKIYSQLEISKVKESVPKTKKMLKRSKNRGKDWFSNFTISFDALEEELNLMN